MLRNHLHILWIHNPNLYGLLLLSVPFLGYYNIYVTSSKDNLELNPSLLTQVSLYLYEDVGLDKELQSGTRNLSGLKYIENADSVSTAEAISYRKFAIIFQLIFILYWVWDA